MGQQKSADQTEKPTPKRLRDARRDGEVARSQELTSTVLLLLWLLMAWLLGNYVFERIAGLFDRTFAAIGQGRRVDVLALGLDAGLSLMLLILPFFVGAALVGLLVDFLQVGAIFAPKRVAPKLDRIDPAAGMKRMFSMESVVEGVKALFKALALLSIFALVMHAVLRWYLELPMGQPGHLMQALWSGLKWIVIWTVFVFFFVASLDVVWQKHLFVKNLRMSKRDIRQEHKDTEGDPMIKGRRRQLHQEWATQNMLATVRQASVVVVNPTHIAVALRYTPGETDLPMVTAKGEDYEAQLIREAAEEAGIPVMQNIELARGLHEKVALEDYIAPDFFEAVAELLRWAEDLKRAREER